MMQRLHHCLIKFSSEAVPWRPGGPPALGRPESATVRAEPFSERPGLLLGGVLEAYGAPKESSESIKKTAFGNDAYKEAKGEPPEPKTEAKRPPKRRPNGT